MQFLSRFTPYLLGARAARRTSWRPITSSTTSSPVTQSPNDLMHQTSAPTIVQYLGFGGAIPFLAGALGTTLCPDPIFFARVTQLYGSSILSFLGAVHWGIALRSGGPASLARNADFLYGVTPSLVAWTASLMPPADGLPLLTASFCAAYAYDYVRLRVPASAPPWYLRMRGPLTIAAVGGCGVSYLAIRRKLARDAPVQENAVLSHAADAHGSHLGTTAGGDEANDRTMADDDDDARAETTGSVASATETGDGGDRVESTLHSNE